jgi:hypothetical protein
VGLISSEFRLKARNMKILSYWCCILILIGLTAMAQDSNRPPEVTNVVAQQVDQQVEISYDLLDRDGDLMTVSLLVSSDGGSSFDLEATSLEGEVGEGIASFCTFGVETLHQWHQPLGTEARYYSTCSWSLSSRASLYS